MSSTPMLETRWSAVPFVVAVSVAAQFAFAAPAPRDLTETTVVNDSITTTQQVKDQLSNSTSNPLVTKRVFTSSTKYSRSTSVEAVQEQTLNISLESVRNSM